MKSRISFVVFGLLGVAVGAVVLSSIDVRSLGQLLRPATEYLVSPKFTWVQSVKLPRDYLPQAICVLDDEDPASYAETGHWTSVFPGSYGERMRVGLPTPGTAPEGSARWLVGKALTKQCKATYKKSPDGYFIFASFRSDSLKETSAGGLGTMMFKIGSLDEIQSGTAESVYVPVNNVWGGFQSPPGNYHSLYPRVTYSYFYPPFREAVWLPVGGNGEQGKKFIIEPDTVVALQTSDANLVIADAIAVVLPPETPRYQNKLSFVDPLPAGVRPGGVYPLTLRLTNAGPDVSNPPSIQLYFDTGYAWTAKSLKECQINDSYPNSYPPNPAKTISCSANPWPPPTNGTYVPNGMHPNASKIWTTSFRVPETAPCGSRVTLTVTQQFIPGSSPLTFRSTVICPTAADTLTLEASPLQAGRSTLKIRNTGTVTLKNARILFSFPKGMIADIQTDAHCDAINVDQVRCFWKELKAQEQGEAVVIGRGTVQCPSVAFASAAALRGTSALQASVELNACP